MHPLWSPIHQNKRAVGFQFFFQSYLIELIRLTQKKGWQLPVLEIMPMSNRFPIEPDI
jgi:hypothetical protein